MISIDNIIGEWAVEYLVDVEEDSSFLEMHVTDLELIFSEKVICLLMLVFTVWSSIVYKGLAQYNPLYNESKLVEYLAWTYVGFFIWPFF